MKQITQEQIKERAGEIYDMANQEYCEFLAKLQLQVEALMEAKKPSITAEEMFEKWFDTTQAFNRTAKEMVLDAIRFTMETMGG